jgi:hypothetical protein
MAHTGLTKGLLAWFGWDGNLKDVITGRLAKVVVGIPQFGTDRAGRGDGALQLSGDTGMSFEGLSINESDFSIQLWTCNARNWLLCQGIARDLHGLHIGVNDTGLRCDYWGSNLVAPFGSASGWTHWVIRHDSRLGERSIWRNGDIAVSRETGPYLGVGDMTIGRHFTGGGFFTGSLDDLALWNRALTDAEISDLFDRGQGLTCTQ